MEMLIRLNWDDFVGTEFKGKPVIGVFQWKNTQLVIRNNDIYGENTHGMEVAIYAAEGNNEVFLFCDYLPWGEDVRDAEFTGSIGEFWC